MSVGRQIPSDEPVDVYFTTTGYHMMLSGTIANTSEHSSVLVVNPSFEDEAIISSLATTNGCPFLHIIVLERDSAWFDQNIPLSFNNFLTRRPISWIRKATNRRRLERELQKYCIFDVYVANHNRPASHYLLDDARNDRIYVEDGLAAYTSAIKHNENKFLKTLLAKGLYGVSWKGRFSLGLDPRLDAMAATFPSYVHEDYRHLQCETIDSSDCLPWLHEWVSAYSSKSDMFEDVGNIDVLVLLPHSDSLTEDNSLLSHINDIIEYLISQDNLIGVKYHPRESKSYVDQQHELLQLPKSIPAEFIYIDNPELSKIIGTTSTALLSAKWLNINAEVYAIGRGNINSEILHLWDCLGISTDDVLV